MFMLNVVPGQLNLLSLLGGQIIQPKQPKSKYAERDFIIREETLSQSSINTSKVIKKDLKISILIMYVGNQTACALVKILVPLVKFWYRAARKLPIPKAITRRATIKEIPYHTCDKFNYNQFWGCFFKKNLK